MCCPSSVSLIPQLDRSWAASPTQSYSRLSALPSVVPHTSSSRSSGCGPIPHGRGNGASDADSLDHTYAPRACYALRVLFYSCNRCQNPLCVSLYVCFTESAPMPRPGPASWRRYHLRIEALNASGSSFGCFANNTLKELHGEIGGDKQEIRKEEYSGYLRNDNTSQCTRLWQSSQFVLLVLL